MDQKIALGYLQVLIRDAVHIILFDVHLQVNTGNYKAGIEIFDGMLREDDKLVAAYLGRGTAYALQAITEKRILHFTSHHHAGKSRSGSKRLFSGR